MNRSCGLFLKLAATLLVVFGSSHLPAIAHQDAKAAAHEQWAFSAEESAFENPAPLTDSVRKILAADPHVARTLASRQINPAELPKQWFTVSKINLGISGETGFVVMGADAMRGANINPFWVFRHTRRGYQLVLTLAAHDLTFLKSTSNKLRDLQSASATASQRSESVYKFDGNVYRVAERSSGPIGVEIPANLAAFRVQKSVVQLPSQSPKAAIDEARAWLWQQYTLEKSVVLRLTSNSKDGEITETTYYLERPSPGQIQFTIQKHQVLADLAVPHSGKPWAITDDQILVATKFERRQGAPEDPAHAKPIPEAQNPPSGPYILVFSNDSGAIVATL
jgi:hypothetical protein